MEKTYLNNVRLNNVTYEKLHVILDDDGNILIVFLLFSLYINNTYQTISLKESVSQTGIQRHIEHKSVSENTINNYVSSIYKFVCYAKEHLPKEFNIQQLYRLNNKFVNHYINSYLACNLSLNSLEFHLSALKSFFNFFTYLHLTAPLELIIYPKAKHLASQNTSLNHIKYLTKDARFDLLIECKTKMHRLLMRTGYELGVRTSENCGFVLHNPVHENGSLSTLFEQLNNPQYNYLRAFEYYLDGRYTKGDKSRILIINRELLSSFYDYYQTERMEILAGRGSNSLFVLTSNAQRGQPISKSHASNIFRGYIKSIDYLSNQHSYHDLRHSYATELYHYELTKGEARSENAALIKTAQALGHSIHKGIPKTTLKYIRLREYMLEIENLEYA